MTVPMCAKVAAGRDWPKDFMTTTTYARHGFVAVIAINNPPVNSLGHELRSGIVTRLDTANADPAVEAIVLIGSDRAFSGGADIREFGTPLAMAEPHLRTVVGIVESSRKPVIAAIGGVCMGGGLELALAAHHRVAKRDATLALPEVKLGLLPGAGGTQRLPRLIGVEAATNIIVSGATIPAHGFEGTTLIDAFIDGPLLEGAVHYAQKVIADKRVLNRARDIKIDYPYQEAFFQFARNTVKAASGRFPAPLKCIDAVQAAVAKSFDEGCQAEIRLFEELIATPESRALRHAFFGERAASRIPDVPASTHLRTIERVGVIGAGTMGGGITMCFANAGIPVLLVEAEQTALGKGLATIRGNYDASVKKGRLATDAAMKRMALISGTLALEDLAECDLIIEAVFEDMGVKQGVFERLDKIAKAGAILGSNTSTLDVDKIAGFTRRPQDVVGMHFFSPANIMRLLEVVRGAVTAKDVLATVMRLAGKIGKTAVVSGVCDGFIGNRMIDRYFKAANGLVLGGALPWQIDQALEEWGMAMGPFRMSDMAGNDITWAVNKRRNEGKPPHPPEVLDRLCELGRFGQKAGKGWYLYQPGKRNALPDPEVERLIEHVRQVRDIPQRKVTNEEIIDRCIYSLVNEGARILEEGIATRSSDIDIVCLYGYGFPPHRGGPMLYADELGLYSVARRMREFAAEGDPFWAPAELISKRVAENKTLT
jgi:3-hydroxyacyl-CoA dehydrogenase